MALRDILDRQAGIIEYVLRTHGISAHIDGGRLSPRLSHFHMALPQGLNPSQLAPFVTEIADALGVVSCRLTNREDGIYLEAPRPDPLPVRLLPLVQRVADVVPPITATLGLDTEGTPLLLRVNSPEVDPVIISGSRDSGKSSLLRGMALSLALHNSPDNLRLLLLDCTGSGTAFYGLESLPHLACPTATRPDDSLAGLRWALRVLSRRTNAQSDGELFFEDGGPESEPSFEYNPPQAEEPALVIMIDGADELCSTPSRRANAEASDALRRLLTAGGGHGIHLVMSAERTDEIVGVSTSWGARIVGRASSPDSARAATGVRGSGAQSLLGAGDFLVTLNAELIRFQAASISQSELEKAVDLICAHSGAYPQPKVAEAAVRGRERVYEEPRPIRREWVGD